VEPAPLAEDDAGNTSLLLGCALGLQLAYVSWGLFQERIATKGYRVSDTGEPEMFPSVTFLVCSNRLSAVLTAMLMLALTARRRRAAAPARRSLSAMEAQMPDAGGAGAPKKLHWRSRAWKYSRVFGPASLSNVFSSWCQYSALQYVSFPTQVLFKSNKIIPTMLMGRLLKGKKHPWRDYAEALVISFCVATFMFYEKKRPRRAAAVEEDGDADVPKAAFGVVMLCGYLFFDSFTSQWQSVGFGKHKLSQYEMMLGINSFSLVYTLLKMSGSGELTESLAFLQRHPTALEHVFAFSICSCVGQLFIFFTIKRFGPVMFSIIMTTRQMLSMVASCLIFGHSLGGASLLAAAVVFSVLGVRIRRRHKGAA